jgi:hypothetical protein
VRSPSPGERLPRQLPQGAFAVAQDRGSPRDAVQERDLAEAVAGAHRPGAASVHDGGERPALDHVKVLAGLALLHDHLAGVRVSLLERGRDRLAADRGDTPEGRHPRQSS